MKNTQKCPECGASIKGAKSRWLVPEKEKAVSLTCARLTGLSNK